MDGHHEFVLEDSNLADIQPSVQARAQNTLPDGVLSLQGAPGCRALGPRQ